MTFEKIFCPSPWFHMRITNSGEYEYCRWNEYVINRTKIPGNVKTHSVAEYFQNSLAPLRHNILNGNAIDGCVDCDAMDQFGKVSGRARQMLKTGVQIKFFEKSLASSTFKRAFDYSNENNGHTLELVQDWQIDLGNFCNSGCVYCNPASSSKLAAEFKQLSIINEVPSAAWCNDVALVDKFCKDLLTSKNLQYLHFIGGETLITPAFRQILTQVVASSRAKEVTIGFTTNLTVWDDSIIELLTNFKQVNVGVSIETMSPLNDYLRWPSNIDKVKQVMSNWAKSANENNWLMQLRVTPTCLSIHELDTVYEYAWENNFSVESCNFLSDPLYFQMGVLPHEYRQLAIERLEKWASSHAVEIDQVITNTRSPSLSRESMYQDALSYIQYLKLVPDLSSELPNLVNFLSKIEKSRGNCILDYIPYYEKLLRSAGY